jgi:hypothetical protein
MNIITRFLDERNHPEKKCERVGHDYKIRFRHGYITPYHWELLKGEKLFSFQVAMETTERQEICGRCGLTLSVKTYSRDGGLNGLTLSADAMRELRETGSYFSEETIVNNPIGGERCAQ